MAHNLIQTIFPSITLFRNVQGKTQELYIQNDRVAIAEVSLDIAGSTGVKILNSEGLNALVKVQPEEKKQLCTLVTSGTWKMVTKFGVKLLPAPREYAIKAIAKDCERIENLVKESQKELAIYDTSILHKKHLGTLPHFIDSHFAPNDSSINLGREDNPCTDAIHWRRPKDFLTGKYEIFLQSIEPNDILQGKLGDCWLMSAVASLSERPELVQRLFITKRVNRKGFYRLRFCIGGMWRTVTVDDYFPCEPKGGPIFSRGNGNELWVLLIEKAYAKIHGSYTLLKNGWAHEAMLDLTGCPTLSYEFSDDNVRKLIETHEFWNMMRRYDDAGYLISGNTPGQDNLTEYKRPSSGGGLVPGHAYAIIQCKEAHGNKLLNIRNPWGNFEWDGKWCDSSPLWTHEMKEAVKPVLNEKDGTFWMSYEDFIINFTSVHICKPAAYNECRVKGYFESYKSEETKIIRSRWCYSLRPRQDTDLCIGIHQEDERIYGAELYRNYLDLGITVLQHINSRFVIIYNSPLERERQVQAEIQLKANNTYIILPRTTGCGLNIDRLAPTASFAWSTSEGNLHPLILSTFKNIFYKASMYLKETLNYYEFSAFMQMAKVTVSQEEFDTLLERYPSKDEGITEEGMVSYLTDILKSRGEKRMKRLLRRWGYDKNLYSANYRPFVLSLHCFTHLNVRLIEAPSELDNTVNEILLKCIGTARGNQGTIGVVYNHEP